MGLEEAIQARSSGEYMRGARKHLRAPSEDQEKHQGSRSAWHGWREESLLVSVPRLGLLPISYKHLDPMDGLGWFPLSNEAFSDVPAAFDEFDTWLSENQPWANQVLYAESMLAIPLFGRRRDEILKAMSEPDFEDWIHTEQEHLDYLLNDWSWG